MCLRASPCELCSQHSWCSDSAVSWPTTKKRKKKQSWKQATQTTLCSESRWKADFYSVFDSSVIQCLVVMSFRWSWPLFSTRVSHKQGQLLPASHFSGLKNLVWKHESKVSFLKCEVCDCPKGTETHFVLLECHYLNITWKNGEMLAEFPSSPHNLIICVCERESTSNM